MKYLFTMLLYVIPTWCMGGTVSTGTLFTFFMLYELARIASAIGKKGGE